MKYVYIVAGVLVVILLIMLGVQAMLNPGEGFSGATQNQGSQNNLSDDAGTFDEVAISENNVPTPTSPSLTMGRIIDTAKRINLPLSGSAPEKNVMHSIPIEDIRRGCFRQDCIPSVDDPKFVTINKANDILPDDTIGIALSYKGVERFYPFNMLVTREIVNDTIAGDPVLVTYCPLCGTGVVFERHVDGVTYEFGVSGMLWQSNLLMYNRASKLEDRNLWSQVLGEAVVGSKTGTKLAIIPSNVVRYVDWRDATPEGEVLNTGRIGDPYNGNYYDVARSFDPDFNEATSPLDPSAYVFGVEIKSQFKAYPEDVLPSTSVKDTFAGETLTIQKGDYGGVEIKDSNGDVVPVVTGFWFSWVAAHPDTELWQNN